MKVWTLGLISCVLTSCAVAPLSNHITARSNGQGNSLASIGSTIATTKDTGWLPSLKYSVGLSPEFDLGFQYEVIEYGLWGKYAFINRNEGLSLAAVGGLGLSLDGFYSYVGPIISWKAGWFEPYFMTRFNYVKNPDHKIDVATIGEFNIPSGIYRYFQHTIGFMAWPLDWFGGGLEVSTFTTLSSPYILQKNSKLLLSGNASFRF